MRVVHFCRWFSALSETFIYDSITELELQGVDNRVIALERQNKECRPFSKVEILERPGPYHPLGFADRVRVRARLAQPHEDSWLGFGSNLARLVQKHRPDIIHAHFGREASLVAPVANRLGIPLVVSFYGYDISKQPLIPWWRKRYEHLWSEAEAVVVLSQEMLDQVARLGCPRDRIHIVHLARRFDELPPRSSHRPVRHFISVGRLVEKKGHLHAVRAVGEVARKYPDLQLDIIGEGPLQRELERLIDKCGLTERVRLLGALPSDETLRRTAEADAFLLCSHTGADGDKEGTPTVLIEAQRLGLPVVSTRHSGIPEMVPPQNHGLLAPEGDIGAIAQRLETVMNSSTEAIERITSLGREFVQEHFDLSITTAKLQKVYSSILHKDHAQEVSAICN